MAEKAKASAKKATTTKATAAKPPAKKAAKSDGWVCEECGFAFVVDDWGDIETHQFICCEKPMKAKAKKAPAKAK